MISSALARNCGASCESAKGGGHGAARQLLRCISRCRSTIKSTSRRQTFFTNVKARSRSASLGGFGSLADKSGTSAGGTAAAIPKPRPSCRPAIRGRAPASISSVRHCRVAAARSHSPMPRARPASSCRTRWLRRPAALRHLTGAGIEPHQAFADPVEGVAAVIGEPAGRLVRCRGFRPPRDRQGGADFPREPQSVTAAGTARKQRQNASSRSPRPAAQMRLC